MVFINPDHKAGYFLGGVTSNFQGYEGDIFLGDKTFGDFLISSKLVKINLMKGTNKNQWNLGEMNQFDRHIGIFINWVAQSPPSKLFTSSLAINMTKLNSPQVLLHVLSRASSWCRGSTLGASGI